MNQNFKRNKLRFNNQQLETIHFKINTSAKHVNCTQASRNGLELFLPKIQSYNKSTTLRKTNLITGIFDSDTGSGYESKSISFEQEIAQVVEKRIDFIRQDTIPINIPASNYKVEYITKEDSIYEKTPKVKTKKTDAIKLNELQNRKKGWMTKMKRAENALKKINKQIKRINDKIKDTCEE